MTRRPMALTGDVDSGRARRCAERIEAVSVFHEYEGADFSKPFAFYSMDAFVVLLPIARAHKLRTPEAVMQQRIAARSALTCCARECGAPLTNWRQAAEGHPVANEGWHWSIAHKPRWAGAALSRRPVGLDIEAISPRRTTLYGEVGREQEWSVLGGQSWENFFRLWTAKEATLKANGVGLNRLDSCVLTDVVDARRLTTRYQGEPWNVVHAYHDGHAVAVAQRA